MGINLSNIPVILIHSHPNSDFSSFCGTVDKIKAGMK